MTKYIIIICLVICLIFSIFINFCLNDVIDELHATNQSYSYCIESESSIKITNLNFYYDGKDEYNLTYFLEGEDCSYYGLTTFREGYPIWMEGEDYGCKLKEDMLKKCEEAKKKAKDKP